MSVVLDTHAWIWFLHGDRKLGRKARDAIDAALSGPGVVIPAITLWEVAMLATRGRVILQRDVLDWIDYHAGLPGFVVQPLSAAIATDSCRLPGEFHNDPADRLIVATARHLRIPLVTVDERVLAYASAGHLRVMSADA